MEGHVVTFERLEREFGLGSIRSIEVDHIHRRLFVVVDSELAEDFEGQAIRQVGYHGANGSRVEKDRG